MARACTVLALVVFLIDANLPSSALSPEFGPSVSAMHCVYREFSSTTQIVLENAGESASRSIARMWCVLTWMGVLIKLKESSITTDAGSIIKMYNEKSSAKATLSGGKRLAVLNLLEKLPAEAQLMLLDDLSTSGFNNTPFTDDAWTDKKLFPGYVWAVPSPAWKSRRTVTNDSFMLFAAHVILQQQEKIPTLRRKWDNNSLEEVAQLAALCMSIAEEAISNLPGDGHEAVTEDFLKAFVNNDPMVVLELQTAVHDLAPNFKWDDITMLQEIGHKARTKALDRSPLASCDKLN